MKKVMTLVSLLMVSSFAVAGFNGSNAPVGGGFSSNGQVAGSVTTIAQALKAYDNTPVQLTGNIVRQIDGDEFIFRDGTGEIKIDVEDEAWQGQNVTPQDKITIYGTVDKEHFERTTIDVYRIQK